MVRKHWRCRSEKCRSQVLDDLRADVGYAEAVLGELIKNGKADHRTWAMWTAPQVLPKARSAAVLDAAVQRERRHDQVDVALGELRDLDVEFVRPYLPRLRRRLSGKDWHSMGFVFWLMADLRDADSLPLIKRAMDRAVSDNMPYVAKLGSVIGSVIRGEEDAILAAIREHDHDRMQWLVEAVRRMDTSVAHAALDACATRGGIDVECRKLCRSALIRGQTPTNEVDHDEVRRRLREEFGDEAVPDPDPVRAHLHDSRGLLRIEEIDQHGARRVVWERPPTGIGRFLGRLRGKPTGR